MNTVFKRHTKTRAAASGVITRPWPDGVIARYLTVARATVDLTHDTEQPDKKLTNAACTGCKATKQCLWSRESYGTPDRYYIQDRSHGDRRAREWAQAHAETCRALPAPAAAGTARA